MHLFFQLPFCNFLHIFEKTGIESSYLTLGSGRFHFFMREQL